MKSRTGLRINGLELLNFVAPKMHAQGVVCIGQENVDRIALDAEGSSLEFGSGSAVEPTDQGVQEGIPSPFLTDLEWNDAFVEFHRIANAVDATDGSDNNDIPSSTQQGRSGAQSQFFDFLVNGEVLFNVGIGGRDVRLGLVVVIVADEILDEVIREKLFELTVQLSSQRFVVA